MALPGATNSHGVQGAQQAVLGAFYNHFSRNQKLALAAAVLAAALFFTLGLQAGGISMLSGSQKNQAVLANDGTPAANSPQAGETSAADGSAAINVDSSSLDVRLNSRSVQSSDGSGNSSSSMSVNGQSVPTDSGNIDKTIISSDGNTKVNIKVNSSSSVGSSGGGM